MSISGALLWVGLDPGASEETQSTLPERLLHAPFEEPVGFELANKAIQRYPKAVFLEINFDGPADLDELVFGIYRSAAAARRDFDWLLDYEKGDPLVRKVVRVDLGESSFCMISRIRGIECYALVDHGLLRARSRVGPPYDGSARKDVVLTLLEAGLSHWSKAVR